MSYESECPACMAGDHDHHDREHGLREGLIGGTYCCCTGDCDLEQRVNDEFARLLDEALGGTQ